MIKEAMIFSGGLGVGAFAARAVLKKKYERIAQEEIDSVKEHFSRKTEKLIINNEAVDSRPIPGYTKAEVATSGYLEVLKDSGYVPEKENNARAPYIISPYEFGEDEEYAKVTLTLYSDGVLTDEDDTPFDCELVGKENLRRFGEYADDALYIRNEDGLVDYEILRCESTYEELLESRPPLPVTDADGRTIVYEEGEGSEE